MKSLIFASTLLSLVSSGCLDFRVEVPVNDFSFKQADADAQMRQALVAYVPTVASLSCERSALAFLLETSVPIDPNVPIPLKMRSDTLKVEEFAPGQAGCADIDATSFLRQKVAMVPRISRVLKIRAGQEGDGSCQEKLSDPNKTQAETVWLSVTGNTLNADISPGRLYYATQEVLENELSKEKLAQLIAEKILVKFASFDAIPSGTNKELEIPIDEAQVSEFTKRLFSKNVQIVVETDDFVLKQIIDRGHGYLESLKGEVKIDVSAIIVTSVSFLDLSCLEELPKRSTKIQ